MQYLYLLAAFVVIVAGLRASEPILNPLLLAIFLSVICAPAYVSLLRRGLSQWLSLLIVAGGLSAVVVVLGVVLLNSFSDFTDRQMHYRQQAQLKEDQLRNLLDSWVARLDTLADSETPADTDSKDEDSTSPAPPSTDDDTAPITSDLNGPQDADSPRDPSPDATETRSTDSQGARPQEFKDAPADRSLMELVSEQFDLNTVLTTLTSVLGNLLSKGVLIMLLVTFILLEVGTFEQKLERAFTRRELTSEQAEQIIHNVQRYMAIKTLMSIVTAALIGLWLKSMDWMGNWLEFYQVEFISLWMLLAFLLNFVPNVGSIAAAIPAIVVVWLDSSLLPAAGVAVGYAVVNMGIGNFVEPRLLGKDMGLSPLVIFCSMVFWGWVLGPVGMLLAVPLTMTVHIVLNGFDDTRWIATLMGDGSIGQPVEETVLENSSRAETG